MWLLIRDGKVEFTMQVAGQIVCTACSATPVRRARPSSSVDLVHVGNCSETLLWQSTTLAPDGDQAADRLGSCWGVASSATEPVGLKQSNWLPNSQSISNHALAAKQPALTQDYASWKPNCHSASMWRSSCHRLVGDTFTVTV